MIFNVVYSSLWLVGCILLAVFNRRIFEWSEGRRKGKKYFHTAKTEWNIKQAFQLADLLFRSSTACWAIFAFNSAISLFKSVSIIANYAIPEMLSTIINFYVQLLWPMIIFVFCIFGIYIFIKFIRNDWGLLPVWIINNTGQSLSIYMRTWFIGVVEPGKRVENNYVHPFYENYLIEAKDATENVVYSREFCRHELEEINGKVEIK